MHRTIKGVGDDGTPFDATDPHQTAWVSMTMIDRSWRSRSGSVVAGCHAQVDAFVREQSTQPRCWTNVSTSTRSSPIPSNEPSSRPEHCRCRSSRRASCPPH
jgi:hypothetical protein